MYRAAAAQGGRAVLLAMLFLLSIVVAAGVLHGGLPVRASAEDTRPVQAEQRAALEQRLRAAREALAARQQTADAGAEAARSLERRRVELERQHAQLKADSARLMAPETAGAAEPDAARAPDTGAQLALVRASLVAIYEAQARLQQQMREDERLRAEVASLARQHGQAVQGSAEVTVPALLILAAAVAVGGTVLVLVLRAVLRALASALARLRRSLIASTGALGLGVRRLGATHWRAIAARRHAARAQAQAAAAPTQVRGRAVERPVRGPSGWVAMSSDQLPMREGAAPTAVPAPTPSSPQPSTVPPSEPLTLSLIDPVPPRGAASPAAWEPVTLRQRPPSSAPAAATADPQVTMVTSAEPVTVKAAVAGRVAASLAAQGRSVLLIEADLRHPRLAGVLQMRPPAAGLADVLAGHRTLDEAIARHPASGCDLLLQGVAALNPGELLFRPALADLMGILRQRYQRIVVHVPPVMAAGDALAFAHLVDSATLVVAVPERASDETSRAVARLQHAGIPVAELLPETALIEPQAAAA